MFNPKLALLYFFVIAVLLKPILGSSEHSYPKSGGFSGKGHRSGGLSGGGSGSHRNPPKSDFSGRTGTHTYPSTGGRHGHPSSGAKPANPSSSGSQRRNSSGGVLSGNSPSGGLSGGGNGYLSSGGSHSGGSNAYLSSGGLSGGGSASHRNPPKSDLSGRTGTHTYPSTGAKSGYSSSGGNHSHSSSGGSRSGNRYEYPQNKPAVHHSTNNYHYHYSPPQQIAYSPHHGAAPVSYPVYHGTPPTYVYQYKDSGSKYGTLLAGLALLNLGTRGVTAHAASGSHGGGGSRTQYTPQPGEVCKFEVRRDKGDYEMTKIDCQIISNFILQDQAQSHASGTNTTTSVVTVTNTTVMNTTNMMPGSPPMAGPVPAVGDVLYKMLSNGTLVPVNATVPGVSVVPGSPANVTQNATGAVQQNVIMTSSVVTITTTNTTLVNALDVKGKPVKVTPGMQCFVIRNSRKHNMRKQVPCGLLQTYADKLIRRKNSAARSAPMFTVVAAILVFCVAYK